ncbi:MAG: DHH family phosphoesterase [Candidatus Verstraetearchaeota archaeon]|nr:DHH family phosphoesterase [Candidatus Verstraetearchaeota archaeon]
MSILEKAMAYVRRKAEEFLPKLRELSPSQVVVVHHDDADGLCAGAVASKALENLGLAPSRVCLEKMIPEAVEKIHSMEGGLIVYCDIGSPHGDMIAKLNHGRNLVVILDHHDPTPGDDPLVIDVNLEYAGFRGEEEFSGATCAYLFAKALSRENIELAPLALVGSMEIPAGFKGINAEVLEEALKEGFVESRGKKLFIKSLGVHVEELFSKLQVLGPVGYYSGGPELGVMSCLEGVSEEFWRRVEELEARRKEANRKLLAMLYRGRLKQEKYIQWFDSGDVYKGMGTKVVGTFCSFLSYQRRLVKPDKYIMGFMEMPRLIPGLGELPKEYTKVSVRVPRELQRMVDEGGRPTAVKLLEEGCRGFGLADGHAYAASAILERSRELELVRKADGFVEEFKEA